MTPARSATLIGDWLAWTISTSAVWIGGLLLTGFAMACSALDLACSQVTDSRVFLAVFAVGGLVAGASLGRAQRARIGLPG